MNTEIKPFSITSFDHTNIPFVDYSDIIGSFSKKSLSLFGSSDVDMMVADLDEEKTGFRSSRIGFTSNNENFKVFILMHDYSVVTIEWESRTYGRGSCCSTYYNMKIKMDTLLETDAWEYINKIVISARKWWIPLSGIVNKRKDW